LIEAGTSVSICGTAVVPTPGVPELELADEEVPAAELVPADDDELLDPQPTIAAALSSETATESQLFDVRIAFLLKFGFPQKTRRSIGNNGFLSRAR
jgi:hypothetical protein